MGCFVAAATAHRAALEALQEELKQIKESITPLIGVSANTSIVLGSASSAINVFADQVNDSAEITNQLLQAASSLGALQLEHEQLRDTLTTAAGQRQACSASDAEFGDRRSKSRDAKRKAKPRAPVDFSAFTRARWEAERLKGASMMGTNDNTEPGESGNSGVRVFMQDMPKPFQQDKPCTQVRGRHIMVNTAEKIRKIYIEISLTGSVDRIGFVRGANAAKFTAIAMERSDCPTGKKGGDLGWIAKGKVEAKLEEVAFVTPKGTCSPPFKVSNGFHIFLCEERKG